ncbi:hypothetical protein E4U60_002026 [Claviceps pazoutovae]|uniref:Uncharacterized protein n=1 Tax=Claviceps pazoutovae TaxID=1649127 RepID=A0A9P7MIS1_9HYPO|nr:hypothetical protein E4U60_002026 [Claviceps pazoutovae]
MAELRVGVGKRSRRPSDGRAVQAQRSQRRWQADTGNTRTRLYLEKEKQISTQPTRRDMCVPVEGSLPVAKCYMLQPASANFLTAEALADGLMWVSWLSTAPNSPIRSAMCRTSASA